MQKRIVTLLIAKPGTLRDSLAILLRALPQLVTVNLANDAASALRILETRRPGLVILDLSLPGAQSWTVLRQIKRRWPHVRCIALADSIRHMHQARAHGADEVVLKGHPAAKLSAVMEKVLRT